jgi:hypothetical protein
VADHLAADFLNDRGEQQPSMRHVATHGMFGVPSGVVCMTEFPPIVERGETLVTVRAVGKKISFVERAWPALQCFLSGRPASIEKVAAATGIDAAALAEVLLAEGICAEVTPELASGYAGLLTSEDR